MPLHSRRCSTQPLDSPRLASPSALTLVGRRTERKWLIAAIRIPDFPEWHANTFQTTSAKRQDLWRIMAPKTMSWIVMAPSRSQDFDITGREAFASRNTLLYYAVTCARLSTDDLMTELLPSWPPQSEQPPRRAVSESLLATMGAVTSYAQDKNLATTGRSDAGTQQRKTVRAGCTGILLLRKFNLYSPCLSRAILLGACPSFELKANNVVSSNCYINPTSTGLLTVSLGITRCYIAKVL
jgi:hypothetical protein